MAAFQTGLGVNYIGSSVAGSHLVGWDKGSVRTEVYSFTTGQWPITHIKWWGPPSSVYQGSNIPVRYTVSTSPTLNTGDSTTGYALVKNSDNEIDVNLDPNTTYYFSFFPGQGRGGGNWGMLNFGYTPQSDNWFTVHATENSYGRCTPPTTLTLSKNIQIPGQNSVLSWSGATAGANLSIAGYHIYRSTTVDGTYKFYGATSGTSLNITAPANRGDYYYYKVQTIASVSAQGAYDSVLSGASGGLKANYLPSAPTVSVNREVVPSGGGSVTFTVTPGTDADNQVYTLAYSTSASGTKTSFSSPLTINSISAATTYYFYTFDGLEYSSTYTSKTITVNIKPVINDSITATVGTYSALGGSGETGYQLGFANTIKPTISTNKTGTVTVELEYYSSDNTTAWSSSSVSRATLQQSTISSTSGVALNNYNIHQYITLGATNIHWRLRFRLNDGIENSDYVYFPKSSESKYYAIAHAPSVQYTYNQFSNSDVTGTISGQVWRRVRLIIYNDTSTPSISATATVNGSVVSTIVATSVDSANRYIDITLPDGIASGATINIAAQMKDSNNYITKSVTTSVTETKTPTLGALTHGAATINPFTATTTSEFEISVAWPFGEYTTIAEALTAYNCSSSGAIKFVHSSSNSGSGANRVIKSESWSKEGSSLKTVLDRQYAYTFNAPPAAHELGFDIYSGSRTYYCRIEITNLFGKVITTPWLSRKFDFRELAVNPTITSIQWAATNEQDTEWHTLENNDHIQEGMYLKFNCTFGLYTTDALTVSIERKIDGDSSSVITVATQDYTAQQLDRADSKTPASNSASYIYRVGEIETLPDWGWRVKIKNTKGTATKPKPSYIYTPVYRHTTPNITLTKCVVNENYETNHELDFAFSMSDDGGGTLSHFLYDGTNVITNQLNGTTVGGITTGSVEVLKDYWIWEVKTISMKTVSVRSQEISGYTYFNTKTFYSNAIVVYQLAPTIAYRKNQLGINTKTPDNDATVDIHQATGKSLVLIHGVMEEDNDLIPTKFEIDVSKGQINYYVNDILQNTIDLLNGTLT